MSRLRSPLRMLDGGEHLPGYQAPPPLSLLGGLNQHVVQPMVNDLRQGHRTMSEHYPLAYQTAQIVNPIAGIAAAGLDYADHMQGQRRADSGIAAMSAVPVSEAAYGHVGTSMPTSVAQAATSHPIPGAGAMARFAPGVFGAMYKAAAGANTAQLGKASYDQFDPEQVAKRRLKPTR